MRKVTKYRITYTSVLDGLRHNYMNIGFDTHEEVQREVEALKRAYNSKWKHLTTQDIIDKYMAGRRIPISMLARDYKIVPIQCTLL